MSRVVLTVVPRLAVAHRVVDQLFPSVVSSVSAVVRHRLAPSGRFLSFSPDELSSQQESAATKFLILRVVAPSLSVTLSLPGKASSPNSVTVTVRYFLGSNTRALDETPNNLIMSIN